MDYYKELAAAMVGVEDWGILHYDFIAYLDDIHRYTKYEGGDLVSRQVIAMAIVTWQKMNPGERIKGDG